MHPISSPGVLFQGKLGGRLPTGLLCGDVHVVCFHWTGVVARANSAWWRASSPGEQ